MQFTVRHVYLKPQNRHHSPFKCTVGTKVSKEFQLSNRYNTDLEHCKLFFYPLLKPRNKKYAMYFL